MKKTLSIILAIVLIVFCTVSCKSEAELSLTGISVTKNPTKTSYKVGEVFDKTGMEVTAYYSDGTSKVVTDYTYSPTTAFDEAGSKKTITITYQGITTKTTVIVEAPVTSVSLSKTSMSVLVGLDKTLVATITPSNATNKKVTWTSSDTSKATVDQNGKVTGVAAGEVTITVTTEDGNKTATCTVTVTATKGYASTNDTNRPAEGEVTNACGWVQLWAGGPKWAEFNVDSTISNYASANQTSNGATASSNPLYCTANVGGLYTWGGSANARSSYSDDHNTDSSDLTGTADTATKKWGNNWQMPTKANINNLINYNDDGSASLTTALTTWTWCDGNTTQYVTGCTLAGYKVTGKGDYANNSIFLPAPGYHNLNLGGQGTSGEYWSSTSDIGDDAFRLGFSSSGKSVDDNARGIGYTVRAILAETN